LFQLPSNFIIAKAEKIIGNYYLKGGIVISPPLIPSPERDWFSRRLYKTWRVKERFRMTIYFYKVNQPYGCFSNFSPHGIHLQGTHWPTVEHYYQSQKFVGTADVALIPLIHAAVTPEKAAALGRDRSRSLRPDWEQVKTQVMREAVLKKFLTHPDIQAILISTGDQHIVENSPTDYYWGCGSDRTGHNHLGIILMSVRQEIRQRLALPVISDEIS
jgi:hypothetical protein